MKKVAVVGLGNISTRHRRNLKLLYPKAILYAMSASGRIPDQEISNCDKLVSSIGELIDEKVELVIVASPAPFHAQHAIPFIEAGIPTLIEKPVTTTLEDAKAIQIAINRGQTPVAIGYCLRYLPSAQKLKTLLDSGEIGELYNVFIDIGQYLPDWRPDKDYRECVSANVNLGGGALFELSHELDYAQWLLGPLDLHHIILRSSEDLALEVEDIVDILAVTQSGTVSNIHLDFLQRQAHRKCSFIGRKGRIEWDLIRNELQLMNATGNHILYSESEWDKNKMYLEMIKDFANMIEGESNQCVTIEQASQTVELITISRKKSEMTKRV